jgi:hypothetical protein
MTQKVKYSLHRMHRPQDVFPTEYRTKYCYDFLSWPKVIPTDKKATINERKKKNMFPKQIYLAVKISQAIFN